MLTESSTRQELATNLNTTVSQITVFEYGKPRFYEEATGLEVHLKIAMVMEDLGFLHLA